LIDKREHGSIAEDAEPLEVDEWVAAAEEESAGEGDPGFVVEQPASRTAPAATTTAEARSFVIPQTWIVLEASTACCSFS
jgi:hypothetical protein